MTNMTKQKPQSQTQWDAIRVVKSETNDNVRKYVFEKPDAVAESVLYKYPTYQDRTVICCSTQSGCPVGCRFCGAGDHFVRSLTPDEITSQPIHLLQETQVDPHQINRLQIMFMSMGEPLLNPKGLYPALTQLYHLYPHAALLISTIGPNINYQPLLTLAKNIPTIGLQFSVHESTDHKRNQLIPFANKLTLQDIAHVGEEFFTLTGRNPFFNYCVHDQNNSQENAQQLAQLFHPAVWQATISVICEREEHVAAANQRQQQLAQDFQTLLAQYQYRTRVFNPAGQDDVGGGCGQLWFVQEWMHNHPKYARPSIGNGLPILHTPSLKV